MTTLEFALILTTLFGIISIWWHFPRWLSIIPLGVIFLAIVQLLTDGYSANLLSVYLVDACLLIIIVFRSFLRRRSTNKPHYWIHKLPGIAGTIAGLFALFLAIRSTLFFSLPPADLSQMSWSKAFSAMHEKVSHEYAFGAWKQINWEALYATYAPQIAMAETQQDERAYYLALRSYTASIPDGHVWLKGPDFGTRKLEVGAGYGFNILGLEDGRIIVTGITPDGPAANAGVQWGAEILSWNGLPIQQALGQTSILWTGRRGAPATLEGEQLAEYQYLVRSPAGAQTRLTFRNPGATRVVETLLTSISDDNLSQDGNSDSSLSPVETGKILPGEVGYLKINYEDNDGGRFNPEDVVQKAMQLFVDNQVSGVILDVRGNRGGDDAMVTRFVGHFFSKREFYEEITVYFQPLNTFIKKPSSLWIEPLEPYYGGPVVVLVDNSCFSSGEGIPMAIQRLPQGTVIGFNGTFGSFGMTGGVIFMPGELTVYFPDGQSLDDQGRIQLDGDYSKQGGVIPNIRLPMTESTARAIYVDNKDVLLDFAIQYLHTNSSVRLGRTLFTYPFGQ
jgi:carboxyl-terminal processing protease